MTDFGVGKSGNGLSFRTRSLAPPLIASAKKKIKVRKYAKSTLGLVLGRHPFGSLWLSQSSLVTNSSTASFSHQTQTSYRQQEHLQITELEPQNGGRRDAEAETFEVHEAGVGDGKVLFFSPLFY